MNRALFVTNKDVLELVLLENFVVDVEHRAARITEDVLDALFVQAADDDFCTRQLHDSPQFAYAKNDQARRAHACRVAAKLLGRGKGMTRPTKARIG